MGTYVHTPKTSYSAGPKQYRSASMLSTQRSLHHIGEHDDQSSLRALSLLQESPITQEDIIRTKTITHVDQFGNTQSITTEVVRALPDGSNIIEKTVDFSRPNSRCNSTRLLLFIPSEHDVHSMSRINEELNDFADSYLEQSRGISKINTSCGLTSSERSNSFSRSQLINLTGVSDYGNRLVEYDIEKQPKSILKKDSIRRGFISTPNAPKAKDELQNSEYGPTSEISLTNGEPTLAQMNSSSQNPHVSSPNRKLTTKIKFASEGTEPERSKVSRNSQKNWKPSKPNENYEAVPSVINRAYRYQNHHRKFRSYSLRGLETSKVDAKQHREPCSIKNSGKSPQIEQKNSDSCDNSNQNFTECSGCPNSESPFTSHNSQVQNEKSNLNESLPSDQNAAEFQQISFKKGIPTSGLSKQSQPASIEPSLPLPVGKKRDTDFLTRELLKAGNALDIISDKTSLTMSNKLLTLAPESHSAATSAPPQNNEPLAKHLAEPSKLRRLFKKLLFN